MANAFSGAGAGPEDQTVSRTNSDELMEERVNTLIEPSEIQNTQNLISQLQRNITDIEAQLRPITLKINELKETIEVIETDDSFDTTVLPNLKSQLILFKQQSSYFEDAIASYVSQIFYLKKTLSPEDTDASAASGSSGFGGDDDVFMGRKTKRTHKSKKSKKLRKPRKTHKYRK